MNNEYNTNQDGIIESTEDAIIIKSLDGTIQSWNKGSEKMFGYTSKEMIGENISIIIPPEFKNDKKNNLSRRSNNEIVDCYETTRINKNDEQLFVSLIGSDIKDSAGNITGSYQVTRDITSQKKNEAELIEAIKELAFQNQEKDKRAAELITTNKELASQNQKNEKRAAELITANKELDFLHKEKHALFASIVNSSDDAMLSKTLDGIITSWNYGAEKIFGYSPNEIIGKNVLTLIPPQLQQEEADIIKKIQNGETINQYETIRVRKDGSTFHASLTISPIRNFEGNITGVSKVLRDVTEKKDLENLLKKSNELARIGGWEFDIQNNTFFWSDITKEIHEVTPDYIPDMHKAIAFYKKGSNRTKITEYIEQATNIGKSYDDEFQIVTAKGNERWVRSLGEAEFVDGHCIRIYGCFQDIDERKKLEIKLIENESYLRTILENEPECVKVLTRKGELVSMNPAGLAMIEADNEQQVLGRRMTEVVNKKYWIGFNRLSAAVFKGNPGSFEFEITGLKGGCRWLETHAVPLKDTTGKIVNLLGVTRDITERKIAEEKIIESENRMRLVTSSAAMGIWYWDIKNDNMVWDKKLYQIYDINESQLGSVYEGWLSRLHPEDKDRVNEVMQTAIAAKKREYCSDFRIIWSDLSVHYIKGTGITEYDDNGNVIKMMGVNWDVTAEKEKERHLKLLESVITNTTDSVLITEAEPFDEPGHRILYVNEAFTKMTGYSSEEVIGKTPRILQGPKSDRAELKRLSKAIRRWESCEITTINYKKNGEEFWVNFSVSPVVNELGLYTHWIAIERDVTDQKKYISAIEIQNTKLREIAWAQSHIVRAPLTRMMGIVSVLGDIKSDSLEYNEWVGHFNDSASELDNIIKDIVSKAQTILLS